MGDQLFVGGSDAKAAAAAIRKGADAARGKLQAVVATPGRMRKVLELAGSEALSLKPLELLVLDEADRLLQLGFSLDINFLLGACPKQRRTGLFSATLTSELQSLMKSGMRNPVHVCVKLKKPDDSKQDACTVASTPKPNEAKAAAGGLARHELPTKLQNFFVALPATRKLGFLKQFLAQPEVKSGKTIIFFLTCASVDYFHLVLRNLVDGAGLTRKEGRKALKGPGRVEKLHGQMEQTARTKAYEKFAKAAPEDGAVLLATDLAARGVDVEAVSWVVQFDAPVDPAAFVHRVGRTARAGQSGKSLAMLLPSEDSYVAFLQGRGITLAELPHLAAQTGGADADNAADAALRRTRKLVESDRNVMLKGSRAFVSFVRAYQEHQLGYVFPFRALDLGALATGFCLLRLPRIKEILGRKVKGFKQSEVDPATVPFTAKAQEKQRQEKMRKAREERAAADAVYESEAAKAWAEEKARRKAERIAAREKAKAEKERTRTQKRRCKRSEKVLEWEALGAEECLAKRARKGKISAEQFAKKVQRREAKRAGADGGTSDSDEDSDDSDGGAGGGGKRGGGESARWLTGRRKRRGKKRR